MLSRRRFLKAAAAAACAGACMPAMHSCNLEPSDEEGAGERVKSYPPSLKRLHAKRDPKGVGDVVAAATGSKPGLTARVAVELLGGMGRFVGKGQSVLIKPNISWMTGRHSGATTNPDVVHELCLMAFEAGASAVTVLDRTCNSAQSSYERSGIKAAAEAAGASAPYVSDDDSGYVEVSFPGGRALKSWSFLRKALEADVYISAPVAKHHSLTGVTLALKNVMGIMGGNRGALHRIMDKALADAAEVVFPDLVVLDASRVLVDHGPTGGNPRDAVERGIVIAGVNPLQVDAYAVDSEGAGLFTTAPSPVTSWRDIGHIREAAERGMGTAEIGTLKILTRKI